MFEKRKCTKLLKSQEEKIERFENLVLEYTKLNLSTEETLLQLVNYMQAISQFRKKEGAFVTGKDIKMDKFYPDVYEHLVNLNAIINSARINKEGWNRADEGEKIQVSNVFLGNIYDYPMYTVEEWIRRPKDSVSPIIRTNKDQIVWDTEVIVKYQLLPFFRGINNNLKNSKITMEVIDSL